jgi:hypothetical protein
MLGMPFRAMFVCENIGLWATAHLDGSVVLRLLPTGAPDERHTIVVDPAAPVPHLNIPEYRVPFTVSHASPLPSDFMCTLDHASKTCWQATS